MEKKNVEKMWIADQGDGTYRNPILYTDYSDPDAIRVGEDYFMVASSFSNAPSVPLLHSRDLVNWKVVNYVMDRLPYERYDKPAHGCGAWAPAIRYHEGVYYVFIPFPDEGILMCRTRDPFGKWEEPVCVKKNIGWIDPCPLWDDDGKAYLVNGFANSRIGFKSALYISPLSPDGTIVLGRGEDGRFVYDGHVTQPTIEGPKLYKRNGYYYIFAPAGGVKTGWQTVLRSRHIYGPYEEKIVMHQGNSSVNGPHQGAWVDTPAGEDWFLHFQDVGNAGRIVHLQPMRWVDDWPVIGEDEDNDGCGEPVLQYRKPTTGAEKTQLPDAPEDSDFFEGKELGLQWQWNANYRKDWYSLDGNGLTLYAQNTEKDLPLCDVPNLLLQKWPAPEFTVTVCLHLDAMEDGDVCGMISLGGRYDSILVCRRNGKLTLHQRIGLFETREEMDTELEALAGDTLYIRMRVEEGSRISWEAGDSGDNLHPVGTVTEALPGRWVGVKSGLTAMHEGEGSCGKLTVEAFVYGNLM
ncbi:glycoside hydrolase family 43 protein [Acetatifactor muris]|uniref:glycoside hydrolase family 43 protein n=1 Tax=Acetatifactor muris TaxID=879566 RepID=UPI0023F1DA0A|nr:glycoside hydrolase 43 family protein [Acetatifactor muris]